MTSATYIARRELVSYHVAESEYTLDFEVSTLGRPSGGDLKTKTESLDGTVETLYFGRRRIWSLTTAPVQLSSALYALLVEFLESTADGQEFELDPHGASGNPAQPMTVIREDDGFSEAAFSPIDGVNDYVQLSFSVRQA